VIGSQGVSGFLHILPLSYKKYYVNQNIEMTKCHLTLTTEFLTLKGSGGWGCPFIEICTVQMGEQTCPMQTSEQMSIGANGWANLPY